MKTLITLIFLSITGILFSQQVAVWNGGTPGRENDWNESRNWNNGKVPDEFTHVIIQYQNNGHFEMPLIKEDVQIISMKILGRANVTVGSGGSLTIDGTYSYSEGISLEGGSVIAHGKIRYEFVDALELNEQVTMVGSYHLDPQ